MKKTLLVLATSFIGCADIYAQLPDSCKLKFGTNISGLSDWGSEQPFVNLMRSAREWYSKDLGNPDGGAFNTEQIPNMTFLQNGYPTHAPQIISGQSYPQSIATIWGSTSGWEVGSYTVLFEGEGVLNFWGAGSNVQHPAANTYTFDVVSPLNNVLEMRIDSSSVSNPIQNIRIVKNEYLSTYQTRPFNPVWAEKVRMFRSVRFMDWGQTNNWNQANSWEWNDSTRYGWDNRASLNNYTWATPRGIPYEMMIKLMNDYNLDGWVCVPHTANNEYITRMAQLFHDNLEPERKLTVEYSNEIWNWMFGQAQWLNQFGCINTGISWPEGTVPYIQNCMDIWTNVYGNDIHRLTRAVGVQTGWLDVAQRTAFNMTPGSFDVIAGTYYFGINDSADTVLDDLGTGATTQDIVGLVRGTWHEGKQMIQNIKSELADSLRIPLAFYEGGQHLTPNPFGTPPTYEQALLDVQRDTAMYNLYNEWFEFLRTLQEGDEPLQCMNFSLIAERSAQYGSWGVWETMFQDTSAIPAPKLQAMIANMHSRCWETTASVSNENIQQTELLIYPNPAQKILFIETEAAQTIAVYSALGNLVASTHLTKGTNIIHCDNWADGIYFILSDKGTKAKLVKQ